MHLRAQGTSNKMHVWVLGFAMLICASVNRLIKMPELSSSVPIVNGWSNLDVGLFQAHGEQLTFFKMCVIRPVVKKLCINRRN